MAAILALRFVVSPVVDHLAFGVPLNVIRTSVRDGRNA
jgi:hypothetical protein